MKTTEQINLGGIGLSKEEELKINKINYILKTNKLAKKIMKSKIKLRKQIVKTRSKEKKEILIDNLLQQIKTLDEIITFELERGQWI